MDPIQQNRLDPTSVNITTPTGSGLFRAQGDYGSMIYKLNPDGSYSALDVTKIGRDQLTAGQTADQYGNFSALSGVNSGSQASYGLDYLKNTYGIDYNNLASFNIADVKNFSTNPYAGDLASYFANPQQASSQTSTINGTQNTLSTPQAGTQQNNAQGTVQPSQGLQGGITAPPVQPQTSQQQMVQNNPNAIVADANGNPTYASQQTPTTGAVTNQAGQAMPVGGSSYTGPSVVDYLNSVGQNSSFSARQALAQQMGISGYTGSATQNTQLLNALRGQAGTSSTSQTQQSSSLPSNQTATTGQVNTPQTATGKTPMQNVIDTYTEVYKQLGISDIKSAYEKTLKDQQDLTNKMNDEIATVNNDPWLSEGVRVQRSQQIKNKYETRLDTLSNYAKLYDSEYQQGQQTAQFLVGQVETDTNKALELAQKKQEALDALTKGTPDIQEYNYAVNQGYTGSFTQYQKEQANLKATIAKAGAAQTILPSGQDLNTKETSDALNTVNSIGNILTDPNFDKAFGALGIARTLLPGTPEYTLASQIQQVKDKLSLAARGQLKGQGQISNFEGLMLSNAQTSLKTGMDPASARQELINIQGALTTSTGGTAKIQIKDASGAIYTVMADSRGITKAIADGLSVKYVQ